MYEETFFVHNTQSTICFLICYSKGSPSVFGRQKPYPIFTKVQKLKKLGFFYEDIGGTTTLLLNGLRQRPCL
ncbi:hypothetical protein ACS0TY_014023 [Phlomoides rotata]